MITIRGGTRHPGTHKHHEERWSPPKSPHSLIEDMRRQWDGANMPTHGLARFAVMGTTFMRIKGGYRSDYLSRILPKFQLIDLGAGYCIDMIRFARAYGIPRYTAVDRHYPYPDFCANPKLAFANTDMLEFLMGQKPGTSNIVMNAIDEIMLYCENEAVAEEYKAWLLAYMSRTVPIGGIAFGLNSPILGDLKELGFREVALNEKFGVPERSFILERCE